MRGAEVFRSFFYEPLQGSRFLLQAEPALKCFCCSGNNEVFKGDFSFFVIKKRSPPLTPP